MKPITRILLIIMGIILIAIGVRSETTINPLTRGQANSLYCAQVDGCIWDNVSQGGSNNSLWTNESGVTTNKNENATTQVFHADKYRATTLHYNWYDNGTDLVLNLSEVNGPAHFEIRTDNSFMHIFGNPNPSVDYQMFTFSETQGADTDIVFYEGGTTHNRIWNSGSMRIGGDRGSLCTVLTSEVDCDTSSSGADLVVQDQIWTGGRSIFTQGTKQNFTEFNISGIGIQYASAPYLGAGTNYPMIMPWSSLGNDFLLFDTGIVIKDDKSASDSTFYMTDRNYVADPKLGYMQFDSVNDDWEMITINSDIFLDGGTDDVQIDAVTLDIDNAIMDMDVDGFYYTGVTQGDFHVLTGAACFTEDTLIDTTRGRRYIADLKAGDIVVQGKSSAVIKGTMSRLSNHYYVLNENTRVTEEHPFMTDKGWKKVKDLKKGDVLIERYGEGVVKSIERIDKPIMVYNIDVGGDDTYYADSYLVHNKALRGYVDLRTLGTASGRSGNITLTTGSGSGFANSGDIYLYTGGSGSGATGDIILSTGTTGLSTAGDIFLYTGAGGISNSLVRIGTGVASNGLGQNSVFIGEDLEVDEIAYFDGDIVFYDEIKPDGATCSDGQILQKTAADDWDCVTPAEGGGGYIDNSSVWQLNAENTTVSLVNESWDLELNLARLSVTTTADSTDGDVINAFDENEYAAYTYVNNTPSIGINYNPGNGSFNFQVAGTYKLDVLVLGQGNANQNYYVNVTKNGGEVLWKHFYYVHNSVEPAPISIPIIKQFNVTDFITVEFGRDPSGSRSVQDGTTMTITRLI